MPTWVTSALEEAACDRDGFAEFYGYAQAESAPSAPKPPDAFAQFYGYPDEDHTAQPGALHLPDRDPARPGDAMAEVRSQRMATDATEAGVALVRREIEGRRASLRTAGGERAERLQKEIHELKLQQARLAGALWAADDARPPPRPRGRSGWRAWTPTRAPRAAPSAPWLAPELAPKAAGTAMRRARSWVGLR